MIFLKFIFILYINSINSKNVIYLEIVFLIFVFIIGDVFVIKIIKEKIIIDYFGIFLYVSKIVNVNIVLLIVIF